MFTICPPQPPRIGGVKVYVDNVKRDEIYMDMEIMLVLFSTENLFTMKT